MYYWFNINTSAGRTTHQDGDPSLNESQMQVQTATHAGEGKRRRRCAGTPERLPGVHRLEVRDS